MKKLLFMLLATVLSLTQMMAQTVPITIGTGTSSNTSGPIPGLYGNHRSIQLFTAAELGQEGACVVDSIALELGSVTAGIGGRAVRIYMKEVIDTTVAASQVIGTLTDGAVLVYSSTDEVCTSNTWHTFVLQTPFAYSGSNSLMIIFEGEGCSTSGSCSVNIKYTDNNKAWTKCWDVTAPDFTTPVAKTNSYRANTRFYVSTTIPADYCPPASNFVFSNLTTDGAEISWTSTATSFEYEYKLASEDWTSENVVSGTTTSPSVSLSGLTSGTSYNFRVKAICASGTEAFWIGEAFLTPCDVYPIPYQQGFEQGFDFTFGSGFIAAPLCWANVNGDASTSYYWKTSTVNHSGGKSAYYYGTASATPAQSDWLITPAFELSGNEAVNFFIKKSSVSYPTGLKVYAYDISGGDITSPADTSLFTLIDSIPASSLTTTQWYDAGVNLSSLTGNYRLALVPTANNGSLYIDDFEIVETSCHRPVMSSLVASGISSTEASLSWTDENASSWKVYYKSLSASGYQSETTSSTSLDLSGLQPGTAYTAYVVAVCGEEESGPTFPVSFMTECAIISNLPWIEGFEADWNSQDLMTGTIAAPYCWLNVNGGGSSYKWESTSSAYESSKAAYMYGYSSNSSSYNTATYKNDDWLITPIIELTGGEVMTFYSKKSYASYSSYNPELRIYALSVSAADMTSGADTANFVAIDSLANLTEDYLEYEIDLSSLSGQYRLAFVRNKTYANGSVYLDNVTVKAAPTCQRVQNLAVTNVSENEITLSWNTEGDAASYKIYYKASGDADWTTVPVTGSPYTIQNLSPATAYTINATAICSDGSETGFIMGPALSAATTCTASVPPFIETFDPYPAGTSATHCWKEGKGLLSNVIMPDSSVTIASSSWDSYSNYVFDKHAAIELYSSNRQDWLITPPINLGDGSVHYDLKFELAFTYWNSAAPATTTKNQKFAVLISTDGGQTWDYENARIWDSTSQDQTNPKIWEISATGERVIMDLSSYTGNIVIGFYGEQTISGGDNRIHIDNVQVVEHVDCPDLDLSSINIALSSTTSVLLNWDTSADTVDVGNGWTVAYEQGTSINDETATTISVPYGTEFPYGITGLTDGGTYTFKVQYDCGGAWSNPVTITLPNSNNIATLPYTCDFEDAEERGKWSIANRDAHTSKWYIGTETDSTNNKLYVSSNNGATLSYNKSQNNVVYAYRYIQFDESADGYKIEFDWYGGGESNFDFVKVGLFDAGIPLEASGTLPAWVGATSVQEGFLYPSDTFKYNLSTTLRHAEILVNGSYANGTIKKLVFAWRQDVSLGNEIGVAIDNISVTTTGCFPIDSIKLAENGRGVNSLTFDIYDDNSSEWEIQYRVYETEAWTSLFTTSSTGNELSDLLSGTMYQIRVRAICGDGDSSWFTNALLYSTLCEAISVTAETPYFEGFEGGWFSGGNSLSTPSNFAPTCWFNINGKDQNRKWTSTTAASHVYNGSKALYFNNSISAAADTISDWFVTPIFDLAGTETFSFFAKLNSAATYPLKVMYYSVDENEDMTSRADTSNFQLLREISLSETTYLPFDIPLNELTPGQYRLAFYASAPGRDVYIDNVSLSIISCQRPDGSTISFSNIEPNSATVSWVDDINTAWMVYYKTSTESDYTSIPATTTSVMLTELTSNTDYEVYITGNCGETESAPSIRTNFSTPCDIVTEFPYSEGFENGLSCWDVSYTSTNTYTYKWTVATSGANPTCTPHGGSNMVKYQSYNAGSGSTSTMISSGFNFSQSMMMKFWMYRTTLYATNNDRVLVYINNLPTEENATLLTTVTLHSTTTGWEEQEVMLPANTSETQYIIFKAISGYGGSIHIDDITIDYPPSCTKPDVASVTVSDITTNTASISWTDNNENNSSWNVYYRVAGSTEEYSILNVSEQSADLTGLTSTEDYEVFVKTACDDGEESDATNTVIFTTLQEAEQIPYTCDFEAEGSNAWLLKNGTCINKWHVGTPSGATNASLYITNDNGTTAAYTLTSTSVVVAEKLFQTGASDSLTISFDLTIGGETSFDYLKVYWVNADTVYTAARGTTPYYGSRDYTSNVIMNNSTNASYRFVNLLTGTQTMSVTIANEPNTLKKLVFVWRNDSGGGTQPGAIIDNVSITEAGNIPEPCDAPTALTASNITQTSAEVSWNGTASSYEVRLNGGTPETVTATSKTFTGLTAGTAYTVEVRAVCESSQSPWVSTSFTTTEAQVDPCDAPTALTASNITQTSAEVSWNGTASSYEVRLNGGTPETVTATSKTFTGLTAGTAYTVEVRAVCESSQSPWVSTSFTTQNESGITAPTVNTLAASNITHDGATLNGTIMAGSEAITAQGFMYKASSAADWTTVAATGENITATLSNLTAETAYEYKAFATTASGTVEGLVMNFTTLEAPVVVTPPTVETLAASNITDNGATLNGTITAGSEEITAQGFMYKASSAADWTTVAATGENITATLSNLTAETAYEYKAFATTASGTVEGQIMSFTTLATSGLADAESGAIKAMIYPNPAKDKATLSLTGLTANAKIIVSDLQGRIIQTEDLQAGSETYELNTSNYASGVYYIRILCSNNVNTQKLIVE